MPKYAITAPNGLKVEVNAPRPPTQEEAANFFVERQRGALENLQSDSRRTETVDIRSMPGGQPAQKEVQEDNIEFYSREIPRALSIPEGQFNPKKGAPGRIRTDLSFFQDMSDKLAVLQSEYGPSNVTALNIQGNPTFLYKDPEAKEWRFVDGKNRLELQDFTSDLVGEAVPLTGGVVAGALATPGGPAAMAAAAAGGEFTFGVIQDLFTERVLREQYGLDDAPVLATVRRRALESVVSGGLDYGAMKALPHVLPGFLGGKQKQGSDVATFEIMNLDKAIRGEQPMPNFMLTGEFSVQRAQDLASRYPNSAVARFFEDVRTRAGMFAEGVIGRRGTTLEHSEQTLRAGFATTTQKLQDDVNRLENSLDSISEQRAAAEARRGTASETKARTEAKRQFRTEAEKILEDLRASPSFSPEEAGARLQRAVALDYARTEARKNQLYDVAYEQLDDYSVTAADISDTLDGISGQGIVDIDGELISAINPGARTASGRAAESLSEIPDSSISFRQLNETIQYFQSKVPSKAGATLTPEQRINKQIAARLRTRRDRLLESAPRTAKETFSNAENYYRETVLPYRERSFFNTINPKIGQNYTNTIDAIRRGEGSPQLPEFKRGGTESLQQALRNPASLREFLSATNNNPEVRNLLREAWLQKKGVVAGQPIKRSNLQMSGSDLDMAKVLWPPAEGRSVSPAVEKLQRLQGFVAKEEEYIEGVTQSTLERMLATNTQEVQREVDNLARREASEKAELQRIKGQTVWQLYSKGALPLPDNEITMQTMVDGLITSRGLDIRTLENLMKEVQVSGPGMKSSFQNAVLYDILRRAGQGTDEGQLGALGYQLWNADNMNSILTQYNDRLVTVFGKNKVEILRNVNTALRRFSVQRSKQAESLRAGSAVSGQGRLSLFLSNISAPVKNRLDLVAMKVAMRVPSLQKTLVDPDTFDEAMSQLYRYIFTTSEGMGELLFQADADPRFREWLNQNYAEVFRNSNASGGEQEDNARPQGQ